MILSSVVIILGEVLELAVLISLFLALSFPFKMSRCWVVYALLTGSAGAILYAASFDSLSQWLDGFGQEVINACIQLGIYICLLLFNTFIFIANKQQHATKYLPWIMALGVCLAVTREGSEIYIYISGFLPSSQLITPVITGSILGAGIGLSLGIVIYYLFINMSNQKSLYLGYSLLLLVAAGMIIQAIRLLIQIDWLPAQEIFWDISSWIDESSVGGRLLYTLIGYEATPTPIEIQGYFSAVTLILLTTFIAHHYIIKALPEKQE